MTDPNRRLGAIPLTPSGFTATATAGGFTLDWNVSSDPTIVSYMVSVAPGANMPFGEAVPVQSVEGPATTTAYAPGYGGSPLTVFLQACGTGGTSGAVSANVTPIGVSYAISPAMAPVTDADTIASALSLLFASLPTTLPATTGIVWSNNGVIQVS